MVKRITLATVIEANEDSDATSLCFEFDRYLRAHQPDELQRAIINVYVADVMLTSNPEEI